MVMTTAVVSLLLVLAQGTSSQDPIRAGAAVPLPRKINDVSPRYPDEARRAGLAGTVVVAFVIDVEGRVRDVRVLEGVPPLSKAVAEAIEKWRYEPRLLDGRAVPVSTTITVRFESGDLELGDLLRSLRSDNPHIRESATRWLGRLGPAKGLTRSQMGKVVKALERLAEKDSEPRARAAAARALARLDGRSLPAGLPATDADEASPARAFAWGAFVDHRGQSEVEEVDEGVGIRVPSGTYDFSLEVEQATGPRLLTTREVDDSAELRVPRGAYELGGEGRRATAPRLLTTVDGDFVAEVEVGTVSAPEGGPNAQGRHGFHGAGLLLWVGEGSYVRLESAVYLRHGPSSPGDPDAGAAVRYALFEGRKGGVIVGSVDGASIALGDASVSLRLERRGSRLSASVRQGDERWRRVG